MTRSYAAALMLIAMLVAAGPADEPAANVDAPPGYGEAPEAIEPPSGYEDAPEAGDVKPRPVDDADKQSDFEKAAAILEVAKPGPNVLNMEKSYLSQFKRLANVERSFLLRACKLDKRQQSRIAEVTEKCAKIAARRYALAQAGNMRGGMMAWDGPVMINGPVMMPGGAVLPGGVGRGNPEFAATLRDPRGAVTNLLLLALEDSLSVEQKKDHIEEKRKREEHFRQAAVLNLVSLIDSRLFLTARQREQLTESLTANWDPSWTGTLNQMVHGSFDYLPQIRDQHVLKFLDEKQKLLWQGIQKVNFGTSGVFSLGHTPRTIEDKFAVLDKESEQIAPKVDP